MQDVSEEMSIEDRWNRIKNSSISTFNEILSPKILKDKEWISNNAVREIEDQRVKKSLVLIVVPEKRRKEPQMSMHKQMIE